MPPDLGSVSKRIEHVPSAAAWSKLAPLISVRDSMLQSEPKLKYNSAASRQ